MDTNFKFGTQTNPPLEKGVFSLNNYPPMLPKTFQDWRKYIYDISGIYFQDNKKYLLESRLQKRLSFLKINTYEEYLDYLKYNPNKEIEKKFLFEVITINETFFFRNQPQLDALVSSVIPDVMSEKKLTNKNTLRIWSAASSSGEEAYSIAMILDDLVRPKYPGLKVEIVGTDINHIVVDTARKGIYREYSVRNMPPYYMKKYIKTVDNTYEVDPKLKPMVNFRIMNLFDDLSMKAMINFDVVYCANVLIYFDLQSKIKVVSNLYNSLNKNGYLFIGYSETLHGVSKAFKLISYPKTIGYKKE